MDQIRVLLRIVAVKSINICFLFGMAKIQELVLNPKHWQRAMLLMSNSRKLRTAALMCYSLEVLSKTRNYNEETSLFLEMSLTNKKSWVRPVKVLNQIIQVQMKLLKHMKVYIWYGQTLELSFTQRPIQAALWLISSFCIYIYRYIYMHITPACDQ